MSFTVRISQAISEGNTNFSDPITYTCGTVSKLDESVADAQTDYALAFAVDISELLVFYLVADQACTIETNSGSVPDDTFTMTANKPVIWRSGDTAILTADVTTLYITNASGSAVSVQCIAGMDT